MRTPCIVAVCWVIPSMQDFRVADTNMLVFKKPCGPNAKHHRPNAKHFGPNVNPYGPNATPNASRWNMGTLGPLALGLTLAM